MGLDLNFWKYKKGVTHNDSQVYEAACCDGEVLEELENLPVGEILEKIADTFTEWNLLDKNTYENKNGSSFQVFTTSQIVRFDCYGMEDADMNLLMDILFSYGCPLYDPQIQERFDSWTDS